MRLMQNHYYSKSKISKMKRKNSKNETIFLEISDGYYERRKSNGIS